MAATAEILWRLRVDGPGPRTPEEIGKGRPVPLRRGLVKLLVILAPAAVRFAARLQHDPLDLLVQALHGAADRSLWYRFHGYAHRSGLEGRRQYASWKLHVLFSRDARIVKRTVLTGQSL